MKTNMSEWFIISYERFITQKRGGKNIKNYNLCVTIFPEMWRQSVC